MANGKWRCQWGSDHFFEVNLGAVDRRWTLETECWSAGVLECWSAGVLECWSAGVLECWSAGTGGSVLPLRPPITPSLHHSITPPPRSAPRPPEIRRRTPEPPAMLRHAVRRSLLPAPPRGISRL